LNAWQLLKVALDPIKTWYPIELNDGLLPNFLGQCCRRT